MPTFATFVLWLHLAAIVAWVGGLFAVSLVCIPVLTKEVSAPKEVARLVVMVVRRFQRISWEIMVFILLTGIFNVIQAGTARGFRFSAAYVGMLVAKVGLFATIAAIQAWQSFRLTPAFVSLALDTRRAAESAPRDAKQLQRQFLVTSLLNLVLAASAIFLGLELRYH